MGICIDFHGDLRWFNWQEGLPSANVRIFEKWTITMLFFFVNPRLCWCGPENHSAKWRSVFLSHTSIKLLEGFLAPNHLAAMGWGGSELQQAPPGILQRELWQTTTKRPPKFWVDDFPFWAQLYGYHLGSNRMMLWFSHETPELPRLKPLNPLIFAIFYFSELPLKTT